MSKKIVLALGGNALGNTPKEQEESVKVTAQSIVDLIEQGHKIVVGHGNGPQVGMISLAFDDGKKVNEKIPYMPLSLVGAMSQGYIGLHLQQAIKNELLKRKIEKNVVSIVTQTVIDKNDSSMKNPTKPIGNFYSEIEAKKLAKEKGWVVNEDSGRGWRRCVPSPKPIDIVEKDIIKELFDRGDIVIAGGGGGIPTIIKNNKYVSVDAVIDKDFTSQKIAELIDADLFMIVTAEDGIVKDFGKKTAKKYNSIFAKDLKILIDSGEFPEGSMKPKALAVYYFVDNTSKEAMITSLDKTKDALLGKAGTIVKK